ncbi:archaellin/type IV pilin N-terminal domain-containing protein [Methanogenium cariaci]|jgi:archaeal flagellin FlaB|uniref:archaellin/type IV pilin N-terminal domain-containing protein n=1 Tax=Methanogenium cariaci TaxID=2197 RepID=UPI000785B6E8|nr:archaellin/type IV pilin N-terminal domain-containing protein [Methanogenium cariaci]
MKQIMNREEGFTGLEAAIVLIAFVVVAAVFSYVVLGAGFFTTQKSQEVVYTSVEMASSSLEVIGDVYGLNTTDPNNVDTIRATFGLSAGGSPVDFSTVQMVFATTDSVVILNNTTPMVSTTGTLSETGNWTIINGATDDDLLLEGQDKFTILAMPKTALNENEQFNLEVRPSVGAAFGLKRTVPAKINAVNILY